MSFAKIIKNYKCCTFRYVFNRKCNKSVFSDLQVNLHSCGNCYLYRLKCSCGEGMIACFIKMSSYIRRYSLDVLRDDEEIC